MRKTYPNTPVITISGGLQSAPTDFLPIVKNYGTSKVFYKPVELTELLAAIREELGE